MATKTERKAQARAERMAREEAAAVAAARRRRLTRLGGVLAAAVAAVAVAIAISSGSSGNKSSPTPSPQAASTVNKLLAGIPQKGNTLGSASAPVQITLYEDLECPICREFTLGAVRDLIAKDVRAGHVKVAFRSLQTATPDPATFQVQQQAALAAGKQDRLWHFVELFYHQQGQEGTGYVTESYLGKLAKQVAGLDHSAWLAARKSGTLGRAVTADESLARSKGFSSTPTIVVQGPKASPAPVAGAISYDQLEQLVKQAGG
jgi:protein-disulfide isomerase